MKKVMKRVITACLAFAMILALVTPASVEAATKNESLTLYKGETYTWYLTGVKSLSSASSTKKAVATVKANKSKKQYTISAKKELDRKSTRLNSSHSDRSRMPSSA